LALSIGKRMADDSCCVRIRACLCMGCTDAQGHAGRAIHPCNMTTFAKMTFRAALAT